jgi:hypothetical protein
MAHLVRQPTLPPKPKSSLDYLDALRAEYHTQLRQAAGPLQFARLLPGAPPAPKKA